MGVKHSYTAASGELVSSPRWNADHVVTDEPSLQIFTFLSEPGGYDNTTDGTPDTWADLARTRITIPGDLMLGYNRVDTSVHWKAQDTATISIRIRDTGNTNTIGNAYVSATGGSYYTTLDEDLSVTWPSGNGTYVIELKSSTATNLITLYNVTLFVRVT